MFVNSHAEIRLRSRLSNAADDPEKPSLADRVIAALESVPGVRGSIAVEVHRWRRATHPDGDQLVVIARDGEVCTVMLRRSWDQPFTPAALRVDRCIAL